MKKLDTPEKLILIFILLLLVLGVLIVPEFGWSTDEGPEGATSLVAYKMFTGTYFENPKVIYENLPRNDKYYGTASTVIFQFVENELFPSKDHATKVVSHFCYYLFFLISIIAVFKLGALFFDSWVALIIAVLYGTQPLLFGHGFINPKDIPTLSVFILTIVLGIAMVNTWANPDNGKSISNHFVIKTKAQKILAIGFLLVFCLTWLSPRIMEFAVKIVEFGLINNDSIVGKLLSSFTTPGNLERYLDLATIKLLKGFRWFFLIVPLILFYLFLSAGRNSTFGPYVNLTLLAASALWGFSISTRVIAFAAGGLVGIYALLKLGKRAIVPLVIYTLAASLISFVTWPFLWVFGFKGFLGSLFMFSDFPWTGGVLFEGLVYLPHELPWDYMPKLLSIQFTEPLVLLSIVGLIISIYLVFFQYQRNKLHVILLLWFVAPILYIILAKPTLYNNFRHFLFITPPLFIFAGFPLERLFSISKNLLFRTILSIIILVPGMISIVEYHPYQYFYYNSFVGGVSGASGDYEMDYWNTAYKEAMDYVNLEVPANNKILIWKNNKLGETYAEKEFDFEVYSPNNIPEITDYDFAIVPIYKYAQFTAFNSFQEVYSVEIDSVKLVSVVKIKD